MTRKFLLFAFLDAICAVSADIVHNASFVCPNEFVRCGDSCYFLSRKSVSWQEAFFECTHLARNSNLAILDNRWKDQSVRDYLQNPQLPQIKRWIGGIYDWKQLKWIWGSTGQKIQYQAFSRRKKEDDQPWKCTFMNPNNYHRWSADDCTHKNYFICEAPAKSLINSVNYIKNS